MACTDMGFSWKMHHKDPFQYSDSLNSIVSIDFTGSLASQRGLASPEFKHEQTREPLWMDGIHNPPQTQEESRDSGVKDGDFRIQKARSEDDLLKVHREFQECTALLNLLKACSNQKDLHKGSRVHADCLKRGLLQENIYIGTALLRMYAKCGVLSKAQEVFDELPIQDVTSWTVLIAGYAEHGLGDKALSCFERMQDTGLSPDAITFVCILKACGSMRAAKKGEEIHAEIGRQGLLKNNIVLGTALVDMYAKCGALAKAQEAFDELPARDVALWTALMAGYAQYGLSVEALNCYRRMRYEGLAPNVVTFVCILKACGSIGVMEKGEEIHSEIRRQGLLRKNIILSNALVDMYAKCGALAKAQEVFDDLPVRNIASWTALIAGYTEHGLGDKALNCFKCMQDEGLSPDAITFVCILKACSSIGAAKKGEEMHGEISRLGLSEKHSFLGNALVDMYAKCGAFAKAQEVFDELPRQDIPSWNALMAGYVQHGCGHEALTCFGQMREEGLSPNAATFICVLKACGSIGAIEEGEEIHAEISRQGLLEKHIELGNALVDMYAKCGMLAKAQEVFDELLIRDVISWTALITGYAQQGLGDKALSCFQQMRDEGLTPDAATFISILKACGSIGAAKKGEEIYNEVCRQGLLEKHIMLGTALVDMYVKCGMLARAQKVFDELPVQDVVSWTVLIAGYSEHGLGDEALNCFGQMRDKGLSPDAATFVCILKACGSIGAAEEGEEIHAEVSSQGLLEKHVEVGSSLVDMYAKCGMLAKAQEVFDELPTRDVVSWTAMIAGYAEGGLGNEALSCFGQMQEEGLFPDAATFVCILKACGSIGVTEEGGEIHAEVGRQGLLEKHIGLRIALVDMYAKCGALAKAQDVFDELPERDVVSWTALMAGYAQLGKVERVFDSFSRMIGERIEPNNVTFVVLLTACSHAGLVEEAQMYFVIMSSVYCIIPMIEHHTSMVDLFSRAGHFDKAISMIKKVPHSDCLPLWLAVLGSCRKWGIVELGRWAFEYAVQLDGKYAATYVCMRNIYAAAGMLEEADEVEALRMKSGAWKIRGGSWWTDVSRLVHSFRVGDKGHSQRKHIYSKLKDIDQNLWLEGYTPRLHWMLQAIPDVGKEDSYCGHSEKFAIACALINTPEGTPIRVTKNKRVCGDCHCAMSLITKLEKRKIQVKDANCIHIFEDGKCVCEG